MPTTITNPESLRKTFGLASLRMPSSPLQRWPLPYSPSQVSQNSTALAIARPAMCSHLRKELAKMDFQWEPLLSVGEINAVQVSAWIWLSTAAKLQLALAKFSLDENLKNVGGHFLTKYLTPVQWFTGKGVYLGLFAIWQRAANFLTTAFSNSQPCNSAPKKGSHKEKSEHSQLKCTLLVPIVLKPMTSLADVFTWSNSSQRQNSRFFERYFLQAKSKLYVAWFHK